MVFSSSLFLAYFLPFFFITYYFIEAKYKNIVLFLFSLCFYTFGCFDNLYYVIILFLSLIVNFSISLFIEKTKSKLLLTIALIYNFSILFVFKYFNFFIEVLNDINLNLPIPKVNLLLPIGISFYTFQMVSYVVDVYFAKIEAEKDFIDYSTYVIMFPQLIAGPIVYFKDIMKDLKIERHISINEIFDGASIFIFGLTSKVFLANQISKIAVDANNFGIDKIDTLGSWLIGIGYSLQMYFDFFGYSLMAIGLGKMIGFIIPKNFDNPFLSKSVEEYWRRWHITLSTWFRDYLFYPILLSNPFKNFRKFISDKCSIKLTNALVNIPAMFIVWFATGLWHGASYNFIIWGLYFFVFMTIEQIFLSKFLKKHNIISHIYLCVVIIISFIIFFNEDLNVVISLIKNLFVAKENVLNDAFLTMIKNNYKILIIAILTVLTIPQKIYNKIKNILPLRILIILTLLSIDIAFIYIGYNDPFLYFRF